MIGLRAAIIAALLALCLGLAAGNASAEKVGMAAAVNPDAYSSLSGAPEKQLRIGKSIFYNERISTDASGVVQVLLVDGSTFTVGANSDLVIDRFVYDPRKKSGEVVATFSKGAMCFIGGKISKNPEGVTVNTQPGHPRRYVPGEPRREKLNFLIPLRRRADLQRKQRPDPYGLPAGLYARLQRRPADSAPCLVPTLSLSGHMKMPGQLSTINTFSGPLAGQLNGGGGVKGDAIGSFARRGSDLRGSVIGNWRADNDIYRATGIFGAGRVQPR